MIDLKLYSQMDPAWKDVLLGSDPKLTIGKFGCLLTSIAMVASAYGFTETPKTLNEKLKAVKGFQGALVMPAYLPAAVPGMLYHDFRICPGGSAPLAEINAFLAAGKPVIVEVDYSPAAGLQNHWIVLYAQQGSDYLIRDPWPYPVETAPILLTKRYGFVGIPARIIQAVLWLDGSTTQVPDSGNPALPRPYLLNLPDRASFPVYAGVDGLALRTQKTVAGATLIKREPLNTRLSVLETDLVARPKLGQAEQWLAVHDPDGDEGYVAAWLVSAASAPGGLGSQVVPDGPAALVVRAVQDQLALRNHPLISDQTLIARLPRNAEFTVLEPAVVARAKLGIKDQWLRVRDAQGREGYVAAWYVALKGN